jgi:Porin PorA
MRRWIGGILVVLGALFVGIGLLAKPYLYDGLAVVPLDQRSTSVSEGDSMAVLYAHEVDGEAQIDKLTGVRVVSTREILGVPGMVEEQGVADTDAFWQSTVKSQAEVDGQLVDLSYSDSGVSIDRRTAEATNCCGDFVSTGDLTDPASVAPMTHEGLVFKFPFDVQQQDYLWWDADVQRADPIKFQGEEEIEGLRVYVFEQQIGPEPIAAIEAPASLFSAGASGTVTATETYSNTRTLWVEPVTGVVIDGNEEIENLYEADGYEPVAKTVGSIGFNTDTVSDNVSVWGSKAALLSFIDNWLTLVGLAVGVILAGLGAFLILSGGQRREQY